MSNVADEVEGAIAFLALGSNVGKRRAHLRDGLRRLLDTGQFALVAVSSLFESEPVACTGGPFLNAVAVVRTRLDARGLLREAKAVERAAGRAGGRGEARPLDVDILFCGDSAWTDGDLMVPHPRLYERPFVLAPLLEVCGDARDPRTGRRIRDEAASASAAHPVGLKRVAGPEWWKADDQGSSREAT